MPARDDEQLKQDLMTLVGQGIEHTPYDTKMLARFIQEDRKAIRRQVSREVEAAGPENDLHQDTCKVSFCDHCSRAEAFNRSNEWWREVIKELSEQQGGK